MLLVVQRVSRAKVEVEEKIVGAIERGLVVLVGVEKGDTRREAEVLAKKVAGLRIFPGRRPMDQALADVGGSVLLISQFTLAGDLRKGRRPGFERAEDPERACALYEYMAEVFREEGVPVETGRFGASMAVELVNDGPVTFTLACKDGALG